jgi:hypothetical protein
MMTKNNGDEEEEEDKHFHGARINPPSRLEIIKKVFAK